jgi:hypothetical protein
MSEGLLRDLLEEGHQWLYRGIPAESDEVNTVRLDGEVIPPRPDRTGENWRRRHTMLDETNTAYTSWSTDRSIAEYISSSIAERVDLSGQIRILRVRLDSLMDDRIFQERDDECEYLIEGTVEEVEFSDDPSAEEEDSSTEEESDG